MKQHARLITRTASAGLILVFVALIVCTVWGAVTMKRVAAQTLKAVALSERYEVLERQLSAEASLVRVHGFDPEGTGWNEERPASISTEATLDIIKSAGGVRDKAIADATVIDHDRYLDILLVLFSQIDNSSPDVAATFKRSVGISERMLMRVDRRALEQHQAAVATLADLGSTQAFIVQLILTASFVGVVLSSAFILLITRYQQAMERARQSELTRFARASLTDTLSGLGNHRAYQEALERELALVSRHGGALTLALIDIDHFKNVNDSLGHIHGDNVLASLGELLRSVRKYDQSFRLGGDEFGVILPLTGTADAVVVLERLRKGAPKALKGSTISVGIATTDGPGIDAVSLRAQADAALYAAKRLGRNSVQTYEGARNHPLVPSSENERSVRRPSDDDRTDAALRPISDVTTAPARSG